MSLADALYWENEMTPKLPVSIWKNPTEDTPDITIQDPNIVYLQTSETVLVKIYRAAFDKKPYLALAKYTRKDYGDGLVPHHQWLVEHHTGNWDSKIVGWYNLPLAEAN